MINVKRFRRDKSSVDDFVYLSRVMRDNYADTLTEENLYFGDQGLLSLAFCGDIQFFAYPQIKNLWYMPYNFCLWFYDRAEELFGGKLWYEPKIVHFAGAPKPWKLDSTANLKRGQAAFYEIWNEFRNRYPMEA